MKESAYPIGRPGKKWDTNEKQQWLSQQHIKRNYLEEVVGKIQALTECFDIVQYGALSYDEARYPLFVLRSLNWDVNKATILVTGGVHGYETSGVQGAIRFAETQGQHYSQFFNILVVPCISPWGYETINRWNPKAIDPNRSFYQDSPAEESALIMQYIASLNVDIKVHVDLHETTDTDNSEFRPALAARDAVSHDIWNIPDGFYLVGNSTKPMADFQQAIISSVEKVTHIAPADESNKLIGEPLQQWGVINYAARELGLCMGFTDAAYVTTTEVYPDSPNSDDESCILAQVAAITGALNFVLDKG
ncbi:M14 family metallopeptidase [Thalassotalea profundi]|uniref:Peptidase n=1 Tax=Thalassotalea profundi TaxID=2036687 RepID=A0ABQ3ILC5_9GAMM|nr:M14 family metallocarboxypeptidase [Thalassotalea profundi]GHE84768.1 peptidase [Thalassotalea profundi]